MIGAMSAIPPDLLRRARSGSTDAQLALGQHYEARGEDRLARGWLAQAAKSGMTQATRALAANLLTRQPLMERDGIAMMRLAARNGDAQAAYICGVLAAQNTHLRNRWEIALTCLQDAAERGDPGATEELALLINTGSPADFDPAPFAEGLPLEEISSAPRAAVIRGCLPKAHCDWLVARAQPRLQRATVYDSRSGGQRVEGARSNSHVVLDLMNTSLVAILLRTRIQACVIPAPARFEVTTMLHYAPGEEFTPHFDYFDSAVPAYGREIVQHGQRVATVLVYLNDDYDGGETEFPRIGLKHKGRKGDALLFWNVTPDGQPDPMSFHAGRPPIRGDKWIVSQWLRGPATPRSA